MKGAMEVKRQRVFLPAAMELRSCTASSKGRKHTMEDVPLIIDSFGESAVRRALYAVLDGHGGRDCATRVAERLPALLAEELSPLEAVGGCYRDAGGPANSASGGSHAGGDGGVGGATGASAAAVKEAVRRAFGRCDAELLVECETHGWFDGCCAIAALLDLHASPPRGYVASLGDCRAYACVDSAGGEVRAVPLCKGDHSPLLPAERRRIEAAGGSVEDGRVCGSLEVSRSFGDARLKNRGVIATPDVLSFVLAAEQRFILLACDGLWRVFSGAQAVEWLHERLGQMDRRRLQLQDQLGSPAVLAGMTRETLATLQRERESATEEGVLRELVRVAVHERHAKDNVTAVLVRMGGGDAGIRAGPGTPPMCSAQAKHTAPIARA
jgi:serine/threonine protein phosphatase PrpC